MQKNWYLSMTHFASKTISNIQLFFVNVLNKIFPEYLEFEYFINRLLTSEKKTLKRVALSF